MVIKHWYSVFFLMIVLPITVILINPTAFFVLMSLITLAVTGSSLKKLAILNFAPDFYIERCGLPQSQVVMSRKEAALKHTMIFGLHLLLLVFFAYTFLATELIWLKAAAVIVSLCWIIDMVRTKINAVRGGIAEGDWTWKDSVAEFFIWFQNIASILLVIAAFAVKFFY